MTEVLLEVEGLGVEIVSQGEVLPVVTDVGFTVARGETLGLVGESGCGKTITALALMGVLPRTGRVSAGSMRFQGQELVGLSRAGIEAIRGRRMAMVFQDPFRCLDPVFTVGDQIAEVARRHLGMSRQASKARAVEMLGLVGIKRPAERVHDYPYMFSGGMAQRVMIAMALTCEPDLLIADEPTTALDVTVQAQVLRLLADLQEDMGLGIIFITHDLGVVAQICDRMAVMYAGQVIETGDVVPMYDEPHHPYTSALLGSIPQADQQAEAFGFIPGRVPPPFAWPSGCRFHPRCAHAQEGRCDVGKAVPLVGRGLDRADRCLRADELDLEGVRHASPV